MNYKGKILLTGVTGYIGKRLLPVLVNEGYFVVCIVRDKKRFNPPPSVRSSLEIIEGDTLRKESLTKIPSDITGAYYLIHSMSSSFNYMELEERSARNFKEVMEERNVSHVIYLSGIVNDKTLSKHLTSRKNVEMILAEGTYNFTTLRAGIIIGSGSASFEIIRDLVEKLPFMITPQWLHTRCQPISIGNVIDYLLKTLFNENTYDQSFDIGGKDTLSYKEMLLQYAQVRSLKRYILTLPVMTPKLSSYWLFFVTAVSYKLAVALVDSMKVEVICRGKNLGKILGITPHSYKEALVKAFEKIESNEIVSSWKDSLISGNLYRDISDFINVPTNGCFKDQRKRTVKDSSQSLEKIWAIGGQNGWYFATWLWKIRGYIDKLFGGVGLRRGRTNTHAINVGDAIDFWRVLYANKEEKRLLLFAEMKLPGEAWLEFKIDGDQLIQTATFRPRGLLGRLYWYTVSPLHEIVFRGLISKLR